MTSKENLSEPDKLPGLEASASQILLRAVELDNERRFPESLVCYREGIEILFRIKNDFELCPDKKKKIRMKIEEYMSRAEKLKIVIEHEKPHRVFKIEAGSIGHDYETIFRPLIDSGLSRVEIDDPYVRMHHQLQNFLRFCEALVKYAENLKEIVLCTGQDAMDGARKSQEEALGQIKKDLKTSRHITLTIKYSTVQHDREIRFNTGWIIQIGRGLDYFRSTPKYSIGYFDLSLRTCHETTVSIFHQRYVRKSSSDFAN